MSTRLSISLPVFSLCLCVASLASGGEYTQDFTFADGTTNLGDGSTMSQTPAGGMVGVYDNSLRLSQDTVGGVYASFKVPDLDPGYTVQQFTATFDAWLFSDNEPADGFSFNFGALPGGDCCGEAGFFSGGGQGLTVGFDTYAPDDGRETQIWVNGVSVGLNETDVFAFDNSTAPVTVHWDEFGLDVIYDGVTLFSDLDVAGLAPQPGWQFGFSARTGGADEELRIDNLRIATVTPEPQTIALWSIIGLGLVGFACVRGWQKL